MIQVPQSKTIETPKGSPKVVGKEVQANLKTSKLNSKENSGIDEFANELDTQLKSQETQFKPVEVSVEKLMELPANLVQPSGESEIVSPKVFDPEMTKEVEKLTAPKTSRVTIDPLTGAPLVQAQESKNALNSELITSAKIENNTKEDKLSSEEDSLVETENLLNFQVHDEPLLSSGKASQATSNFKSEQVLLKTPQVDSEVVSKVPLKNQPNSFLSSELQFDKASVKSEGVEGLILNSSAPAVAATTPVLMNSSIHQGRHPAIDLTSSEVDPQLLSNEDFIAQKNIFSKKMVSNPYGLKSLPVEAKKITIDPSLPELKMATDFKPIENSTMNSQQFILGIQAEKNIPQNIETQASVKVFDMSKIKSSDTNELMNQITDYVVQAKAAKEPTVNMRVNHVELGTIDISVSKVGVNQDAIVVNIGTHSIDGKNFFQQNTKDLFNHLNTAGLNVSDLKVEIPQQTAKNDFDFGSQSGKGSQQQGSEKQFGSEQNQRRHESERRQDLWKLLNKEAA
jgi:hypothetical protein